MNLNKKNLISMLKECKAIQFGQFVLTSGAVSNYYIDIKKASTNPKILKFIAESIAPYTTNYDIIAGVELGAVPIVVAVSLATNKPYVIIRKEKKEHGTGRLIEGPSVSNKKVLLVEDVTTTGGSVAGAVNLLRQNGAIIDKVVVVVDRLSGARERLKEIKVDLVPLVDVDDVLKK
ncbi:MAG TPA: orotate phosphoribosyltransferase [Thermoplasmatales archaeon]|nr:orotate phosphoribosyltransferase [Thermoplasmatales archaeon]HEX08306.1 orotate phosphoribosyltransferase [Thermoplasmatales archaeon]